MTGIMIKYGVVLVVLLALGCSGYELPVGTLRGAAAKAALHLDEAKSKLEEVVDVSKFDDVVSHIGSSLPALASLNVRSAVSSVSPVAVETVRWGSSPDEMLHAKEIFPKISHADVGDVVQTLEGVVGDVEVAIKDKLASLPTHSLAEKIVPAEAVFEKISSKFTHAELTKKVALLDELEFGDWPADLEVDQLLSKLNVVKHSEVMELLADLESHKLAQKLKQLPNGKALIEKLPSMSVEEIEDVLSELGLLKVDGAVEQLHSMVHQLKGKTTEAVNFGKLGEFLNKIFSTEVIKKLKEYFHHESNSSSSTPTPTTATRTTPTPTTTPTTTRW
eukprot:GHVS01041236.1.p1 GENE.GHVS01041236.1~~GHVS01041236.1.p1  ORF type:complete len:333 (-),score=88.56 GHVS01041236.1:295-1293(-)